MEGFVSMCMWRAVTMKYNSPQWTMQVARLTCIVTGKSRNYNAYCSSTIRHVWCDVRGKSRNYNAHRLQYKLINWTTINTLLWCLTVLVFVLVLSPYNIFIQHNYYVRHVVFSKHAMHSLKGC